MSSHVRKLRYRSILNDLSLLDIDSSNNNERLDKTSEAVHAAQSLLSEGGVEERVKHPGEGYLDSRVLRATSDLAVICSESVSGNTHSYDRHDLARHIKENPDYWTFSFPREAPTYSYLFGSFDPTPPEERPRAPRRVVERQRVGDLKQPEDVKKLDKSEEGSEMVSKVHRFATKLYKNKGNTPLSYFHLVLDPNSFAQSIENVYYISFLVRDRLLSVYEDENTGLPFVKPVPHSERENDDRDISEENQFIVSLDIDRWKSLVDAFGIQRPLMVLKK